MSPRIDEVLRAGARRLDASSSCPERDAEELLSRLLGLDLPALRLAASAPLDEETARRFDDWLGRRAAGEPVQYITGRAAFRDLDLAVTPAVLVPRPETEGLVELVLRALAEESRRWTNPRVLDLGTGSGAIALAVAHESCTARVTATDRSAEALAVAAANARDLGLADRVRLLHGDWFEAVDADERFEVVVSNPPYIAREEWDDLPDDVRLHEPHAALFARDFGLADLRTIVDRAPLHLVAGGLLAVELAETRAAEVAAWLDGAHDWATAELLDDLSGRPRYLVARREKGPAIAPAQWGEER